MSGYMTYVQARYPSIKRGAMVTTVFGGKGRVTSANQFGQVRVRLDGEKQSWQYHPGDLTVLAAGELKEKAQ